MKTEVEWKFVKSARTAVVVVTSCLVPLWCHGFCQLSISQYSQRSSCFSFKPMDDLISFLTTAYRLDDKWLSIKTVWQKLNIQNWAFFGLI